MRVSSLPVTKAIRMPLFTIIDAPSMLGLGPTGVEELPQALKAAGLLDQIPARYGGSIPVPPDSRERDPEILVLNPIAIRTFSQALAEAVARTVKNGEFPLVLGGDCSIEIGNALALRRLGRYGLFFIDGHADFYQPEADPTGEVSSMELAIISGRGPELLTNIDGLKPLLQEHDIVVFGFRDEEEASQEGSQDVNDTDMHVYSLRRIREVGLTLAAEQALLSLTRPDLRGFWIHLDADVLDDKIMPAVDYRLPGGGFSFEELSMLLRLLLDSGRAVGLSVTIFNPRLDPNGSIARAFSRSLAACLASDAPIPNQT